MVDPQQAWGLISSALKPLPVVRQKLSESAGCVLAEDVRADRDLPPADRSAMDGYAVQAADLKNIPCRLKLIGEVAAGSAERPRVVAGACARILTGANLPPGANSVVIVEDTHEIGGLVEIRAGVKPGANILKRGEDARKGQILIPKGAVLDAARIGVCAAVGKATVKIFRRPRLTVLCTGAELKAPGDAVRSHQLRNSNGPALCAALALEHFVPVTYATLLDNIGRLARALRQALRRYDVILLTGGMSVGKYDIVRETLVRIGARVRLHGVAMKPGKPFLFATWPARSGCATGVAGGRGRGVIFGLPGNPLSALTGLHEFVLPALRRMSGWPLAECRPCLRLRLGAELKSKGGRVRYLLGRLNLNDGSPGTTSVIPVKSKSSADLVSAGKADGAIIVPAHVKSLPSGAILEFRPWRALIH
ncbi:MAG: molybdopterin molybdotransferase MoeA [Lentisphaerae bacterium]|nr:molybdopterin molybdotransferase MoeA [Lentisphaerota bacterium]